MSSKTLSLLVRLSVIAAGVCGLAICFFILPYLGNSFVTRAPEFSRCFWPWLTFLWIIAVPCFTILAYIWRVSYAIENETVFTLKTAKLVKSGSVLLFSDAVVFFVGNIILLVFNMNHPGMLLLSMLIDIFAVALSVLAGVLSRYLTKAAVLQEEADGTV